MHTMEDLGMEREYWWRVYDCGTGDRPMEGVVLARSLKDAMEKAVDVVRGIFGSGFDRGLAVGLAGAAVSRN